MNRYSPKTLPQYVFYYSLCLLLVTPAFFHHGLFVDVMTAVDALVVVAVAAMVLMRCGVR
jgi:hypothetical protein